MSLFELYHLEEIAFWWLHESDPVWSEPGRLWQPSHVFKLLQELFAGRPESVCTDGQLGLLIHNSANTGCLVVPVCLPHQIE